MRVMGTMVTATSKRKLGPLMLAIACEELESRAVAAMGRAERLTGDAAIAALAEADRYTSAMEQLCSEAIGV